MDKKSEGMKVGVGAGVLAGAIAGILLAPESGKEMRTEIVEHVRDMKDKIAEELVKASKLTRENYNQIVEKIVKAYETGKNITAGDAKDIQAKLDKDYDKVMKTLHDKKVAEIEKVNKG